MKTPYKLDRRHNMKPSDLYTNQMVLWILCIKFLKDEKSEISQKQMEKIKIQCLVNYLSMNNNIDGVDLNPN